LRANRGRSLDVPEHEDEEALTVPSDCGAGRERGVDVQRAEGVAKRADAGAGGVLEQDALHAEGLVADSTGLEHDKTNLRGEDKER
jgi:hypothetical protein